MKHINLKTVSLRQRKDKESIFKKFFFVFVCFTSLTVNANNDSLFFKEVELASEHEIEFNENLKDSSVTVKVKFKRGKAILFTVFTGFLGGHRIYLGTHHRTPIIYSLTFGGLGILPIIDLVHLIVTKDISQFEQKTQIVMWGR